MSKRSIPYLSLNPEIERLIREDRARGWKNPAAFKDEDVLRRGAF